jgi:hypothetical protein
MLFRESVTSSAQNVLDRHRRVGRHPVRLYTTTSGGALYFPILATPTGEVQIVTMGVEPGQYRGVMMPMRKRTRAQEWLAATYEAPPF